MRDPNDYADESDDEDEWELGYEEEAEQWPTCGCVFCFCLNETEFGEACPDCRSGAHQG